MAGYVVAEIIRVRDPALWEEYRSQVPATVKQYGGRYIVRGGLVQALEGEWRPTLVILEFENAERARAWYESPEYRALNEMRQRSADTRLLIVDGV